jgi:predicted O-linked N-acetylglucosamine transferase (SPINDLY family)
VDPRQPEALYLLGMVQSHLGQPAIAAAFFQKAIQARPQAGEYHRALGLAQLAECHDEAALASFQRAFNLEPDDAARLLLEGMHVLVGANGRQAPPARHACSSPDSGPAYLQLARLLRELGRRDDALALARQALLVKPGLGEAWSLIGHVQLLKGRWDLALESYRRAIELEPGSASARSHLVFALHYDPGCSPETLLAEARAWARRHAEPLAAQPERHTNSPETARPLRVGYVSADLCEHPVGYFLEAVLQSHDASQVEAFCYSDGHHFDAVTERLRGLAHQWRWIGSDDHQRVAEMVRRDRIDILVDLAGHTGGHRLQVFARKPAPVQATWLGYSGTTGLSQIDYVIGDRCVFPEDSDAQCTERVIRLPRPYLSYTPRQAVPVLELPAPRHGYVTFGCFNKIAKVNERVIATWAALLPLVPNSRLLMKDRAFDDDDVREWYTRLFVERGVAPERLSLQGGFTLQSRHLDAFNSVDIALDPFPYNGCTSTLEALWMGVPVVTLAGTHFASRMGVSLLSGVGLTELIANSPEDYVRRAAELATDLPRLAALRTGLRERLVRSPLCDGPGFTRELEGAFRAMWRAWCATQASTGHSSSLVE